MTVVPGGRYWPVSASRLTTLPAELRTLVISVTLAATDMPLFEKSTVTFVDVPGAEGFGEIPCREMLAGDDGDNGLADDDGLAEGDSGLADADGVAEGDNGLADEDGAADDDALGEDDGVADEDGAADDDALADDEGLACVMLAELGEWVPATSTPNDLVARPWPPCHISKPASTSIRYHEGLIQPRLIASAIRGCRSRLVTEVVPVFIV